MLNIEKQVELAWEGTEVEVVCGVGGGRREVWELEGVAGRQTQRQRQRQRASCVGWAKAGSDGVWRMDTREGVPV
jgi:hypothetical protein